MIRRWLLAAEFLNDSLPEAWKDGKWCFRQEQPMLQVIAMEGTMCNSCGDVGAFGYIANDPHGCPKS